MPETIRRVAVTRRVDLSEYGDGLEGCYAVVKLIDYDGLVQSSELEVEKMNNLQATKMMLQVAKQHFIAGKIRVYKDDGELEVVDMIADDIAASSRIISAIYTTVMGVTLDPKAIPTDQPIKNEPTNDESTTKTSSSTESDQSQTQ